MVKNGLQFRFDPFFYDSRRIGSINPVHFLVDKFCQLFCRVLDLRREKFLWKQFDDLDLICYCPGVFYHYFISGLRPEIVEFLQHLVGRPQEYPAVPVSIGIFAGCQQDLSVLLILFIQKMHIARGNHRLSGTSAQFKNPPVEFPEFLLVLNGTVFHEETVVAERLYLQIVIKARNSVEFSVFCSAHNSFKYFAGCTGRTDKKAFAVKNKVAFRNNRGTVEVFEIRI